MKIDFNGKTIRIQPRILINQLDGKVLKEISGANGTYCLDCLATKQTANDIEQVKIGFDLNRSTAKMIALYDKIGDNLASMKSGDRLGLTNKPMLHSYYLSMINGSIA